MLQRDRELNYERYRHREAATDAIMNAADIPSTAADEFRRSLQLTAAIMRVRVRVRATKLGRRNGAVLKARLRQRHASSVERRRHILSRFSIGSTRFARLTVIHSSSMSDRGWISMRSTALAPSSPMINSKPRSVGLINSLARHQRSICDLRAGRLDDRHPLGKLPLDEL